MIHFRNEYNEYDLEAAIEHGINIDSGLIVFSHYDDSTEHIELLNSLGCCDTSTLTNYPKGWAIGKNRKEVISALTFINKTIESYWEEILDGFEQTKLPPVIVINNKLCDGAHRTILCYLFNTKVRIAYFQVPQ